MKKGLLEKVKADYKKREDRMYDLLYIFYGLTPEKFKWHIEYHGWEGADMLFFNAKEIGHLKDITDIYEVKTEEEEKTIIKFEKMDWKNTGEVYETRQLIFEWEKVEDKIVFKYELEDWKENPEYTGKTPLTLEEQFDAWLDHMDLALGTIVSNNKSVSIGDFRKEVYNKEGFLYLTDIKPSDWNGWTIEDNLGRKFILTDGVFDEDEEDITPVKEGEMPF